MQVAVPNPQTGIQLTDEQQYVLDYLFKDRHHKRIQTMGGYAGVGKTLVLAHLIKRLEAERENWAVCAFTGKATNQLRRKGVVGAKTIHSLIYIPKPSVEDEWDPVTEKWVEVRHMGWEPQDELDVTGIIVDEASMVSGSLCRDLESYGKPIIYVGDHGQLEPIGENPGLMDNPMYRLETIHRNAGEIAYFAEHLRKGYRAGDFHATDKVAFMSYADLNSNDEVLLGVDQIICAFNRTRCEINQKVRQLLGKGDELLTIGERIMCLRNNKEYGIFNGMQGVVTKIEWGRMVGDKAVPRITFQADDLVVENINLDPDQFGREKPLQKFGNDIEGLELFDYVYGATAHKCQGDQFDSVLVIEQKCPYWTHSRWTYTAASRAVNGLVWVC